MSRRSDRAGAIKAGYTPDYSRVDTGLEELFRFEEIQPREEPRSRRWLPRAARNTFIASIVVFFGAHLFGYSPPYLFILAVCAGTTAVRRAVAFLAEPSWRRISDYVRRLGPAERARAGGGWYESGDGMLAAVRRWDRRLEWGATSAVRYAHSVAGQVTELVDERLRQRHGFTMATDPARARRLLGESVWRALHPGPDEIPTAAQLAAVTDKLDAI